MLTIFRDFKKWLMYLSCSAICQPFCHGVYGSSERCLLVLNRDEEEPRGPVVGDGLRVDDLDGREDGEVGDEGEDVDGGGEGDPDGDGERQIPARVLDLLRDKVEVVPPVVGPQAGEEGQGDGAGGDRVARRRRDGVEPFGEELSPERESQKLVS